MEVARWNNPVQKQELRGLELILWGVSVAFFAGVLFKSYLWLGLGYSGRGGQSSHVYLIISALVAGLAFFYAVTLRKIRRADPFENFVTIDDSQVVHAVVLKGRHLRMFRTRFSCQKLTHVLLTSTHLRFEEGSRFINIPLESIEEAERESLLLEVKKRVAPHVFKVMETA
ncbi:hypothetical protein EON81_01360 [bacterium]|nr:MAG: hypothetical protein EON81_01360 [bacterium]